MVKILLIRHGYSVTNKKGCFTGRLDVPLDEIGRKQAILLAEYLKNHYLVDKIYSSDLTRVIETVRPLSELIKTSIILVPSLRETDIGRWQGKCVSELNKAEPLLVKKMEEDPYGFKFPDGECESEVFDRAIETLNRIVFENEEKTVVVATHGGVIRSLLRKFLNIPSDRTDLVPIVNNASVSVIEYENGEIKPTKIGTDDFLKDLSTSYLFK